METFIYFAYGSNMLIQWLKVRCSSAEAIGNAQAQDYRLAFVKKSDDGSGKATLLHAPGSVTHGVLFRIPMKERSRLDSAEGKDYQRDDGFMVAGISLPVTIYLAVPTAIDVNLQPYYWYRDLVRAGAKQHGLPTEYQDHLAIVAADVDSNATRENRLKAISFLKEVDMPCSASW